MRVSRLFFPSLRENPKEAETVSHVFMLRAGLVRKLASGVYTLLPIGYRVIKKIENIIREEMDAKGGQELFMPALQPAELWLESGRWYDYGPELMRLEDRKERTFALGPTHEEVITALVRDNNRSYRKLPLLLYQIQVKFRDEIRPRFGVMRAREFIMKDLYSFDKDEEGMNRSYDAMYDAYCRIFKRCGLDYRVVEADSGAIGGDVSHEFMVLADTGEAEIAFCDSCGYASNLEKATDRLDPPEDVEELEIEEVYTPNIKTIEELAKFLAIDKKRTVKAVVYEAIYSGEKWNIVAAFVRGDYDINEIKLKNLLGCLYLNPATEEEVLSITPGGGGFIGPMGLTNAVVVVDESVMRMKNVVVGANKKDYHLKNVNPKRDFPEDIKVADIRKVHDGNKCPKCGSSMKVRRGIEVGHIFKLGTKYSEVMNATFLDENGEKKYYVMGCYGIGVERTMAAVIEQLHDDKGIIWPMTIAPYHVIVIPVVVKDEEQRSVAERIYSELLERGVEVLIDDRDESPGVKFNDADIMGIPLRVTVGKYLKEGKVELKWRRSGEVRLYPVNEIVEAVETAIKKEIDEINS